MNLDKYIDRIIHVLAEFTPVVISALLVLLIGLWVIKRIAIFSQRAFEKRDLDVSLRTFLRSLISIGLKIILIVTVAGMLGIGTASFVTILGAAGLAVGLALQGSLSNFAGGVLILIFKPYKVGDTIEAQGQTGEVREIQIFNTIMITADGRTVILPNGALSNGTIVNITRNGFIRLDIPVSVAVENDIEKVRSVIFSVLDKNDMILKTPSPIILIQRIAEGAVHIQVRPYCSYDNSTIVVSQTNEALKEEFKKHNISGAIQTRFIHNI